MDLPGYHIDWKRIKTEAGTASRIFLRVPPGLVRSAPKIIDYISKYTRAPVELLLQSCYGACDYPPGIYSFPLCKNEKIFHIGDASMPCLHLPSSISFFEAQSSHPVTAVVTRAIKSLEGKNIGLVTTTPWIHTLSKCKKILAEKGYCPHIGKRGNRAAYDGQILGCDLTAAVTISSSIDSFLYIGDGMFHPLGVTLATHKPVIAADPIEKKIKKQEIKDLKDTILRQRNAALAHAYDAQTYGIIICQKIGQYRPRVATHLKTLIEKKGKKAYYLTLDNMSPLDLDAMGIDCYVSTACPRIAIDDYHLYKKPVLTPLELEIHLGNREWNTYEFDQIL